MESESYDTDTDISIPENAVILTPDEMLMHGLTLLGWKKDRLGKRKLEPTLTSVVACMG